MPTTNQLNHQPQASHHRRIATTATATGSATPKNTAAFVTFAPDSRGGSSPPERERERDPENARENGENVLRSGLTLNPT